MAMNSPSGPIEATRNASMITGVMMARDREKRTDSLDERERDRQIQDQFEADMAARDRERPGLLKRIFRFWE